MFIKKINHYVSIPIRGKKPPTHSKVRVLKDSFFLHFEWPSVGQSNVNFCAKIFLKTNCLSAIRFRGGVFLQVSCYTLLMRIPSYMATDLLFEPHGKPFRFIGRLEQIGLSPAYLESVRLNPSSPVLLTRNGPLRIFDTLNTFVSCVKLNV